MNNALSSQTRFEVAVTTTAGAAGATNINGSVIDTANAIGVAFLARFGPIVAGAVVSVKAQHGDEADLSDATDIEDSSQVVADTAGGGLVVVDIHKPTKRYLRLVVLRATQNATVQAEALVYGTRSAPVDQPDGVTVEQIGSPVSGTA